MASILINECCWVISDERSSVHGKHRIQAGGVYVRHYGTVVFNEGPTLCWKRGLYMALNFPTFRVLR